MSSSGSSPPRPPPPAGTTSSSGPPAVPPPPSSAARVHESSLGDLPTMESAPPSGNFTSTAASLALNLNPLPPPPPPPKSVRMARALSPPRSGNYHSKSLTAVSPLPPPPKVAVTPPAAVATAAATSNQQAAIPAPLPPPPPPPPAVKASSLPSPPSLDNDRPATVDNDELLFPPPRLPLGTFEPALDPHKGPSLLARRQTHIPVLVISTESAQMIAWKNGLQLIDLFQGIARQVHTSNTPFRSINNKSLTLTPAQFQVEFVDPSQLTPCSYSSAHALLQEQAKLQESDGNIAQELELLEDRVELLLQDSTSSEDDDVDLRQVTKDAFLLTSPLDIPWLLRYRQALDASTNAMPHDLIACPALVLLVCSTDEVESPVQVLQELYNAPHILPDCFKNGLYDPVVRHEVLVLHDNVEGPPNIDDAALRYTLQQQFGPQSQVLRINNVPKDVALALAAEEDTDIWGGGGTRGTRLSVNDRALLRRYFQTLLTSSLLPALERRIADLNAIVSERKKGVRNLVKNFWRKPKEEIDTTATTTTTFNLQNTTLDDSDNMAMVVLYRHDSIESQTRLLADTLFLIQDYESALATYRLIREDFKSDKALVHYASVQEMMALCMYHLDTYGRARDIFACLELALLSYTRAAEEERKLILGGKDVSARPPTAPHATRLATRLCLLMATASDALTKGRELEVADLLASASSHESSLGAAVLLEQASAFYYEAGMYRKYAFHMLMSGHMFRTANQDHHAFRCFCSALYIYRHGKWAELHNHLKSALAAQLYTMGRMSVAMMLYAKLVEGAGKVSSKSQQKFLTHLLEICLEHPKKALVGADRMAVPPHVSSARERDALRQDRLERMVEIIQYTPGASRVLELPYLNLPKLFDSSVRLWTHAEEHFLPTTTTSSNNTAEEQQPAFEMAVVDPSKSTAGKTLGKICKGDDEVWDNLELLATAEWNAVDSTVRGLDETVTAALSKIKDTQHRQVIGQIDKEKQSKALMERSRRNGSLKPKAAVRARMEPIFCDFALENPLDVDISITQLQLVARMVDASDTICTNQDAIQIAGGTTDQTWTFPSTEQQEFQVADFCRLSTRNQRACVTATSNPFFVVTKQTLELKAGKKDVVSAGLTPMVEGDLEILGVRYKLSDQVWVYHPFHIPGPLLDDTRSNRANRVRGESLVLKSTISVDMPCVTAELVKRSSSSSTTSSPVVTSDDGGPLLEGQISHWTIRLRNIGSAPASQLIVKTNLPWINIPSKRSGDKVAPEVREGQATSYCIGPTGTLMSLPLEGSHLKVAGTIHPGETVDIPIQIRTSGSGRRHFYMLYRYALYDDESQQSSRTRWLRKMYEVPVFPTLSLTARVVPSLMKDNEQLLSVEMTNNRTDRPTDLYVTLDKLSLASRSYRLEALPGQFSTSEQSGNVLQIGWQERMTVHYRVVPMAEESQVCQLSECPFLDDAPATNQECCKTNAMDFLCLERACETFEAAWTSHQTELIRAEHSQDGGGNHPRSIASIRRANTADSTGIPDSRDEEALHPTSIGMLCPSETSSSKVHILCNWRAILGDEVIRGEHHMRAVSIRPRTYFKGCPVNATASHPLTLSHDFSKGPAVVPVSVTLRNRMLETPVNFVVSVDKNPSFELIGLDVLLLSLDPSQDIEIPFEALIPKAGIHDLQALQLTVHHDDQDLPFELPQQWLVHVTDSSSLSSSN